MYNIECFLLAVEKGGSRYAYALIYLKNILTRSNNPRLLLSANETDSMLTFLKC